MTTPRQQARAANLERIKALALQQLAESGAATLSLRAVARELDIVSSAIYRYYPSRDELITDLVLDAYTDLAARLESAGEGRRTARRRWLATCEAMRSWAVEQPHRFSLIYGSAIPGYAAPAATVEPAGRVVRCFFAAAPGASAASTEQSVPRSLRHQLAVVSTVLGADDDTATALTQVGAFARVVGLLTLELNGHFVGGFEPADLLFSALVEREADALGL